MRCKDFLSGLLAVMTIGFATPGQSATVNIIKNPATTAVTISGVRYLPSSYSRCADMSSARLYNRYYWCTTKIGTLTAKQVSTLNAPPGTKLIGAGTSSGYRVLYLDNPITKAVYLQGLAYLPSDYSKCASNGAATIWQGFYWCKAAAGVLTAARVSALLNTGTTTAYTANLAWAAPTSRVNGKPLQISEIKGYEIYYTSDDLSQGKTIPITGGTSTRYALTSLKAGTYHFAISAIDTKGLKSSLSPVVSKTVGR